MENYKQAMYYFNLADKKENYSEAFGYYRSEVLSKYIGTILTSIIIIIFLIKIYGVYRNKRKGAKNK